MQRKRVPATESIGQTYGRLTVTALRSVGKGRDKQAICSCSCGNSFVGWLRHIRNGSTSSCGCLEEEARFNSRLTHGHKAKRTQTKTYNTWISMKYRCYNPKQEAYPRYGGRGIKICERWRNDFSAFLADMGERPPNTTIDRIDVNGDYEPSNCRWASPKEQRTNQRLYL